jgi:hypothetical protein
MNEWTKEETNKVMSRSDIVQNTKIVFQILPFHRLSLSMNLPVIVCQTGLTKFVSSVLTIKTILEHMVKVCTL